MASDQSLVDYLIGKMEEAGEVTARKMFGEYGLYCDGKIFALVCDNALFIKPTPAGRIFTGTPTEAPPYPGARPSFMIAEEKWDDREWLGHLVRVTLADLPAPKPKKKRVRS